MGKFENKLRNQAVGPVGVISTEKAPSGRTYNGAPGFTRDAKSELFLLAVTNFVSEDTFYEDAKGRDTRFKDLVQDVAAADPKWTAEFLKWLRNDANMRSAAIVGAIEAGRALSAQGEIPPVLVVTKVPGTSTPSTEVNVTARQLVSSVLIRADEPSDALAYWIGTYGKPLPQWFKRGLGDAVVRLFTEYNYLKWDSDRSAVRMADVLEFTRIKREKGDNSGLFKYILDQRHGRGDPEGLPMISTRKGLMQVPSDQRREILRRSSSEPFSGAPNVLRDAGMTWESLSGWLPGGMDSEAWEAAIPQMGYMALLRNLRNFDQAGISKAARNKVAEKLRDPEQVAKSRQLVMRFLSAYNAAPSDFWKPVLDDAIEESLKSLPVFKGHWLWLVDTSGSMNSGFSKDGTLKRWDAATVFALAGARASEKATVVSFASNTKVFNLTKGANLLSEVDKFRKGYFINSGTATEEAVRSHFNKHDGVVVLTDEQADGRYGGYYGYGGDPGKALPKTTPLYTFNLAGYKMAHTSSDVNRHTVGGLSDAGFKMISMLEALRYGKSSWPWEIEN